MSSRIRSSYQIEGNELSEINDHVLVPFEDGETVGFQVIRSADGEPAGFPRGSGGLYIFQAKGVSNYGPALQRGAYDPGQALTLVAEPENPHDANAISIWDRHGQHMVGYVSRGNAERLAPRLRAGVDIRGYVLRIDKWKGGRAHLHALIVDMEEASIALPEDAGAPIPGSWDES